MLNKLNSRVKKWDYISWTSSFVGSSVRLEAYMKLTCFFHEAVTHRVNNNNYIGRENSDEISESRIVVVGLFFVFCDLFDIRTG